MEDLNNYRKNIDKIDTGLVELFEQRMEISLKVAEYKRQHDMEVLNTRREDEVIERGLQKVKNNQFHGAIEEFLTEIMRISRKAQHQFISKDRLKIGFQGVPGAYSEQALIEYFGDNVDTYSVKAFEDVFIELKNGKIDFGVVPIENSSTGGISEVYDLLNKYDFHITGEICIKINHHLMGIRGAKVDDIKEVYSHPQGLAQCGEFLKFHPGWKQIPYDNTANSAKLIKEKNDKSMAVIASEKAAKIYELDILASCINSNVNNITRFAIIGKELTIMEECDKVSIILSTEHKAGSLFKVLQCFADNNINLLKIESRPLKSKPWEYLFYIDFEGNMNSDEVKRVIELIEENSHYCKILGNYKKACD